MTNLRNERGIALMMAICLTLISMVIILSVLYIITQGTQLSASSRRYKSALEASYGGVDVVTREILPMILSGTTQSQIASAASDGLSSVMYGNNPVFTTYTSCMKTKLASAPSAWGTMCGPGPMAASNLPQTYDVKFKLKGPPLQPNFNNFNVYAKITDTQPGNSDMSGTGENLMGGAGVAYGAAGVSPMHIPATYRIEVQGERESNPLEKAKLSVLYAY